MRVIGYKDGVYVYAPRKREDTSAALDQISELHKDVDISYVGITSEDDLRKNGYTALVETLAGKVDFSKYNLIFVTLNETEEMLPMPTKTMP